MSSFDSKAELGKNLNHATTVGGHTLDTSQPSFPVYHRKFGNPAPLGLLVFGGTTLLLSFMLVNTKGVNIDNMIVSLALPYGGLVQILVGMWEMAAGNTFGATLFTAFGSFWISYATIYWPNSGILAAYADAPDQLENALGIYLAMFMILTFVFFLASFRTSIVLSATLFFIFMTFMLLSIGKFRASVATGKAGGAMGIAGGALATYLGAAGLLTPETSFFTLPIGDLSRKD